MAKLLTTAYYMWTLSECLKVNIMYCALQASPQVHMVVESWS